MYHDITWRNGGPPRDEPECGFEGEKCINEFGMILFLMFMTGTKPSSVIKDYLLLALLVLYLLDILQTKECITIALSIRHKLLKYLNKDNVGSYKLFKYLIKGYAD